jgi:hypothetical protein
VFDVREVVEAVDVDTRDLNLVARASRVHLIIEDVDFLLSGNTTGRDSPWCLLNGHLLIVSIDSVDLVHGEGPVALTDDALPEELLPLLSIRVEDRSLDVSAAASVEDLRVLREDSCALRDDSADLNQRVHVDHAQVSQLVLNREVLDTSEDHRVDHVVLREKLKGYI